MHDILFLMMICIAGATYCQILDEIFKESILKIRCNHCDEEVKLTNLDFDSKYPEIYYCPNCQTQINL